MQWPGRPQFSIAKNEFQQPEHSAGQKGQTRTIMVMLLTGMINSLAEKQIIRLGTHPHTFG
jgi:hypothetical protein